MNAKILSPWIGLTLALLALSPCVGEEDHEGRIEKEFGLLCELEGFSYSVRRDRFLRFGKKALPYLRKAAKAKEWRPRSVARGLLCAIDNPRRTEEVRRAFLRPGAGKWEACTKAGPPRVRFVGPASPFSKDWKRIKMSGGGLWTAPSPVPVPVPTPTPGPGGGPPIFRPGPTSAGIVLDRSDVSMLLDLIVATVSRVRDDPPPMPCGPDGRCLGSPPPLPRPWKCLAAAVVFSLLAGNDHADALLFLMGRHYGPDKVFERSLFHLGKAAVPALLASLRACPSEPVGWEASPARKRAYQALSAARILGQLGCEEAAPILREHLIRLPVMRGSVEVITRALRRIETLRGGAPSLVRTHLEALKKFRPGSKAYWAQKASRSTTYAKLREAVLFLGESARKELEKELSTGRGPYGPVIAAGLLYEMDHPEQARNLYRRCGGKAWCYWQVQWMKKDVAHGSAPLTLLVEKEVCRRPPDQAEALAKAFLPLLRKESPDWSGLLDHASPAVRQVAALFHASHGGSAKAIQVLIREGSRERSRVWRRLAHDLFVNRRVARAELRKTLRSKASRAQRSFCSNVLASISRQESEAQRSRTQGRRVGRSSPEKRQPLENLYTLAWNRDPRGLEMMLSQFRKPEPREEQSKKEWVEATRKCMELAWRYGDARLRQPALRLLKDPRFEGACLCVLARHPGPDLPELVLRTRSFLNTRWSCGAALPVLVSCLGLDAVNFLCRQVEENPVQETRLASVRALVSLRTDQGVYPSVWTSRFKEKAAREEARLLARKLGLPVLVRALLDGSPKVRRAAACGIASLARDWSNGCARSDGFLTHEGAEELLAWMERWKVFPLQVVDYLLAARPRELRTLLLSAFIEKRHADLALVSLLGRVECRAAVPHICLSLQASVSANDLKTGRKEMLALARLGARGQEALYRVLLQCPRLEFRVEAARALASVKYGRAFNTIQWYLERLAFAGVTAAPADGVPGARLWSERKAAKGLAQALLALDVSRGYAVLAWLCTEGRRSKSWGSAGPAICQVLESRDLYLQRERPLAAVEPVEQTHEPMTSAEYSLVPMLAHADAFACMNAWGEETVKNQRRKAAVERGQPFLRVVLHVCHPCEMSKIDLREAAKVLAKDPGDEDALARLSLGIYEGAPPLEACEPGSEAARLLLAVQRWRRSRKDQCKRPIDSPGTRRWSAFLLAYYWPLAGLRGFARANRARLLSLYDQPEDWKERILVPLLAAMRHSALHHDRAWLAAFCRDARGIVRETAKQVLAKGIAAYDPRCLNGRWPGLPPQGR